MPKRKQVQTKIVELGDMDYDKVYMRHEFDSEDAVRKIARFSESALKLQKGQRILDLGCGIGDYSLELARRGYEIVGVDISKNFLRQAEERRKKENLNVKFMKRDYHRLDFRDEFSAVICLSAFFGIDDDRLLALCKRIYEALKRGGRLLFDNVNLLFAGTRFPPKVEWWEEEDNVYILRKEKFNLQTQVLSFTWLMLDLNEAKISKNEGELKLFSFLELKNALELCGFRVENVYKAYELRKYDPYCGRKFVIVAAK